MPSKSSALIAPLPVVPLELLAPFSLGVPDWCLGVAPLLAFPDCLLLRIALRRATAALVAALAAAALVTATAAAAAEAATAALEEASAALCIDMPDHYGCVPYV